jgi:ferric-dicitrate binding protein FerR (iron transport regulator)
LEQIDYAEQGMDEADDQPPLPDAELMLRKINKKAQIKEIRRYRLSDLRKYAAVLLAAILSGSMVWLFTKDEGTGGMVMFAVSSGNKGTMVLPDGSEAFLNSESQITYSSHNKRYLHLEGEAFLSVAKDKKHPFIVNTLYGDILVYGTTFNVTAYPNDSILSVSLIEGNVGVQISGEDEITHILPGQVIQVNARNHTFEISNSDSEDVALWRKEEIQLTNTVPGSLFRKMEHWYGITIKLKNVPQKQHLYNISFRNERVEEMLELINKVTPIIYRIDGKEVTIEYVN